MPSIWPGNDKYQFDKSMGWLNHGFLNPRSPAHEASALPIQLPHPVTSALYVQTYTYVSLLIVCTHIHTYIYIYIYIYAYLYISIYIYIYISMHIYTYVIVCTDLWGKELHRQAGVGIVVTSGSLSGVMVAHWPGMPNIGVRVLL